MRLGENDITTCSGTMSCSEGVMLTIVCAVGVPNFQCAAVWRSKMGAKIRLSIRILFSAMPFESELIAVPTSCSMPSNFIKGGQIAFAKLEAPSDRMWVGRPKTWKQRLKTL